eukprot:Gb_37555 [translate_table: standard]
MLENSPVKSIQQPFEEESSWLLSSDFGFDPVEAVRMTELSCSEETILITEKTERRILIYLINFMYAPLSFLFSACKRALLALVVSAAFILLLPAALASRHVRLQSDDRSHLAQNREFQSTVPVKGKIEPKRFTLARQHVRAKGHEKHALKDKVQEMLQIAGSSLPDCSHACGACFPCRRLTVSFKCSVTEESESCPMAYRCMCRGKSFPIP